MAWRRPGDKPLSEPMMVSVLTHICVTWPQWVKAYNTTIKMVKYQAATKMLKIRQNYERHEWAMQWLLRVFWRKINSRNSKQCLLLIPVSFIIPPASTKLKGGILVSPCLFVCPSIRLSICGQNRVRSVSSTILVGSIWICTSDQATSEGVSLVMFV